MTKGSVVSTRIKTDHELIETLGVDSAGGAGLDVRVRLGEAANKRSTVMGVTAEQLRGPVAAPCGNDLVDEPSPLRQVYR
jgi:hypothetical protein